MIIYSSRSNNRKGTDSYMMVKSYHRGTRCCILPYKNKLQKPFKNLLRKDTYDTANSEGETDEMQPDRQMEVYQGLPHLEERGRHIQGENSEYRI